jgi:hypothetical protein
MPHPSRSPRRSGPALLAALACGLLLSCSDGILPPDRSAPASLEVVSRDPHRGVAGQRLPDSVVVRVVDRLGRGIPGAVVRFSVAAGGGTISPEALNADGEGYARATWVFGGAGEQAASARVDGLPPAELRGRVFPVPAAAAPMLGILGDRMAASMANLVDALPRNPRIASYIQAKIDMLRTPGLGGDILEGARYAGGSVKSRAGTIAPVTAVFPLEGMRADAVRSVRDAESAVPVLEEFLGTAFPTPAVRIWYGFTVGNSGGGGTITAEDRGTYEARTPETRLPHDAMIVHELGHSFVGNESLTQFLELYGYNVLLTGSPELSTWTFTRGYVPGAESSEGVHALLDVYRLIGPRAMASAFRAVLPLRPPYGQPLSAAARQAFVDAAPADAKAQVAAKVARIQG